MATSLTPRLRQDLTVTPTQDAAGVAYFDVRDPRTGNVLRLYDVEWWVAERFDGVSSYDDLARWSQDALGFTPSRADLEVYAQRLQTLGLFDVLDARAVVSHAHPSQPSPSGLTPAVAGALSQISQVLTEQGEPAPPPPVSMPRGGVPMAIERRDRDRPSLRLATIAMPSAADDVMGPPLMPATDLSAPQRAAVEVPQEDDRRSTLIMPTMVEAPAPASQSAASQARSNEPRTVPRVQLPPSSAAPIAPLESPPSAPSASGSAEPVPVVVTEPERSAPLMGPPPDLRVESGEAPPRTEPTSKDTPSYANGDSRPRDAETDLETPLKTALPTVKIPTTPAETEPAQGRSTVVTARSEAESVAVARGDDEDEVPQGGIGRWIALLAVLLALGVAVYYVFQLRNTPRTLVSVVRVQPHEVQRTGDAAAVVRGSSGTMLRLEAGGLLSSVVSEGAEVSSGMSLAVLQTHGKLQKEIVDLRDRLTYYQRKLEQAKEKGEGGAEREAQAKVNEKQERLVSAEASLKKSELLAPRSGTVRRVLVKAGEVVTPGSEILELSDRGLGAELRLPASEGLRVGQEIKLRGPSGMVSAKVIDSRGAARSATDAAEPSGADTSKGLVTLQLELPEGAGIKAGDELRLVKGQLADVVELPDAAIVSGDSVYVVAQGKAARRKISVVDHEGNQALVKGLQPGDEVIVSGGADLREGQPVQVSANP